MNPRDRTARGKLEKAAKDCLTFSTDHYQALENIEALLRDYIRLIAKSKEAPVGTTCEYLSTLDNMVQKEMDDFRKMRNRLSKALEDNEAPEADGVNQTVIAAAFGRGVQQMVRAVRRAANRRWGVSE